LARPVAAVVLEPRDGRAGGDGDGGALTQIDGSAVEK